jgi:hypothetical protein
MLFSKSIAVAVSIGAFALAAPSPVSYFVPYYFSYLCSELNLWQIAPGCSKDFCAGTIFNSSQYFCGDPRLGPVKLPTKLPLGTIVSDYDRLGGSPCPAVFLAKWFNATSNSYIFPPDSGFQLDTLTNPIEGNQTLTVGMLVDRFGSEFGSFLAPVDAPFNQLSLPPQSLDTPVGDPSFPFNYHVYKVSTPFVVLSGPIASWFGQPGQGTQYQTSSNIMSLINGGFLTRVDLKSMQGKDKMNQK